MRLVYLCVVMPQEVDDHPEKVLHSQHTFALCPPCAKALCLTQAQKYEEDFVPTLRKFTPVQEDRGCCADVTWHSSFGACRGQLSPTGKSTSTWVNELKGAFSDSSQLYDIFICK